MEIQSFQVCYTIYKNWFQSFIRSVTGCQKRKNERITCKRRTKESGERQCQVDDGYLLHRQTDALHVNRQERDESRRR